MKFLTMLSMGCALALAAFAQTATDADALFRQLQEQMQQSPPEGTPQEKRHAWYAVSYDRASRLAGEFAEKYPSDARVWTALGYVASFDRQSATPVEAAAFARQQQEVRTRLLTAPGVPENVLAQAYLAEMKPLLERQPAAPADLARVGELLAQFRQRAPEAGSRAYAEHQYLEALQRADEAAAEVYAKSLSADPNARVVELGQKTAAAIAFRREPVSLKSTAFDGREVDFTKLRGKVVLIDFWATWCVPCMEQMPEIKRIYRQYHEQGLEIVGVADEVMPRDPAKPHGAEKTPAMLQVFLDQHEMSWPQLWDQRSVSERHGVNRFAALFGVGSLPTTFLLDRDGRIYSTDNHGAKLEQNVRKLLGLPAVASGDLAAAPAGNADEDYTKLAALRSARVPEGLGKEERDLADRRNRDQAGRAAEKFLADHPDDPRRWEVMAQVAGTLRLFSGPDAAAEEKAWSARRLRIREELLTDPRVPLDLWVHVAWLKVNDLVGNRGAQRDLPAAERLVAEMRRRAPLAEKREFSENLYLRALTEADPAAAAALVQRLASEAEPSANLRELAAGLLRTEEFRKTPMDIKFTAVDGREVDSTKLRGKVVLVDFWATWCVPCMEEMPNVKRIYEKYHAQGLEIVGISFERTGIAPALAIDRTVEQLRTFLEQQQMPWPQYYDGKYWKNAFGRRFSIGSIPATFLIGKDGRLVTIENRGEKLEANVRAALGLTP